MSQTLPIRENYLVVFINIILHGLYSKIRLEIRPGICPTDRGKKKLKKFMVSRNLRQAHLLEVGLT